MLKDKLIAKVSEDLELPESLILKIVNFQGEDASKHAYTAKEMEFSGFGKFILSQTKLNRRIKALEKHIDTHPDHRKIDILKKILEDLKALL